jgi:filamentous hemagglutinin
MGGGAVDGDGPARDDEDLRRGKPKDRHSYDPNSMFQVVGSGELSEEHKNRLTDEERNKFSGR